MATMPGAASELVGRADALLTLREAWATTAMDGALGVALLGGDAREAEVLALMAGERTNGELASPSTSAPHAGVVSKILTKLVGRSGAGCLLAHRGRVLSP